MLERRAEITQQIKKFLSRYGECQETNPALHQNHQSLKNYSYFAVYNMHFLPNFLRENEETLYMGSANSISI